MSLARLLVPFAKDPKSTNEIIIALKQCLTEYSKHHKNGSKLLRIASKITPYYVSEPHKDICRLLMKIKEYIYGSVVSAPETEANRSQLVYELYKSDLLLILVENLPNIGFDGRKDIALIYEYAIGQQIGTQLPSVEYIASKPLIMELLMNYYSRIELVTTSGAIIRECLRFAPLTEILLIPESSEGESIYLRLFDLVKSDSFIVCSDVFLTLEVLFSRHINLVKRVLKRDFDIFFSEFNKLLRIDNYYINRKAIHLLSEILLNRNNQSIMKTFVNIVDNLDLILKLLESDCPYTSFDAYLVFSLFALNPNKNSRISKKLMSETKRLIPFFETFIEKRPNSRNHSKEMKELIEVLRITEKLNEEKSK